MSRRALDMPAPGNSAGIFGEGISAPPGGPDDYRGRMLGRLLAGRAGRRVTNEFAKASMERYMRPRLSRSLPVTA